MNVQTEKERFEHYEEQIKDFFKKIREIRKNEGIKIGDVAKATGIEPSYLSRMERGERSNPSFYHIYMLADYYSIDLYTIYKKPNNTEIL